LGLTSFLEESESSDNSNEQSRNTDDTSGAAVIASIVATVTVTITTAPATSTQVWLIIGRVAGAAIVIVVAAEVQCRDGNVTIGLRRGRSRRSFGGARVCGVVAAAAGVACQARATGLSSIAVVSITAANRSRRDAVAITLVLVRSAA
jgi:hypothetical protein